MSDGDPRTEIAILLDVGSAWAKAGVIGRVRGEWRLMAHAAQPTAWGSAELRRALVDQLQRAGDPRLVDRYDELMSAANRIECHTARRIGRIAVVAVSRELSGSAARRAAEAAGWEVVELVTLDDGRSLAERIATLQAVEVDAWLVAGGFEDGASPRAMEAAALVAAARTSGKGPVVWAGTSQLAEDVVALFEPDAASAVANPRADARREDPEPLREHLRELRGAVVQDDEAHLSSVALPRAVGQLARQGSLRVLAVDVGARTAIAALAEPDGAVAVRIHAGGGIAGVARTPGAASRVARLAVDGGDEAAVADLLETIRARPATLPETAEELAATQAAARVAIGALVDEMGIGQVDLVIGSGRTVAGAPHPGQAVRMLLDGVRPIGVTQLAIDPASLLGPLGSLADDELGEGLTLLGGDLLAPLGTAVVTRGGEPGEPAMRVTAHRPGWPATAPINVRVGQIQVLPLPAGQTAELTIEPAAGVSLGAGRRSPRIQAVATGGAIGIVLDARGIPIALPRRAEDRRAVVAGWQDAVQRETERVA
jgi:MutL-like protein